MNGNGIIRIFFDGQERQINGRVGEIIKLLCSQPVLQRISGPAKGKAIINFGGDSLTIDITESFSLKTVDIERKF